MTEMPTFELEHPYADLLGFVIEYITEHNKCENLKKTRADGAHIFH